MTNTFRTFLAAFVFLCSSAFLRAATFVVTQFTDTAAGMGGEGPGVPGDLRSAILTANLAGGAGNTIVFSCGAPPCTITLNGPLPPITSNLIIDGGTFGTIVIDGNSSYRVFFVDTGTVTLEHLQIQNAAANGGAGGQGSSGAGGGAGLGAGLFVNRATASVSVQMVLFKNVTATGGNGGSSFSASAGSGGGGGGMGFNGANGDILSGFDGGGGGGGIQGPGGALNGLVGGDGGAGGGGAGGTNGNGIVGFGTGGSAYAGNTAGQGGGTHTAGNGGFGGGGGGGDVAGTAGAGGFGGGGGGSDVGFGLTGAAGGFGGGGGGGGANNGGASSASVGGVAGGAGGNGDDNGNGGAGGGGAAAGPAIFVAFGSISVLNSAATGTITATAGTGGAASAGGTTAGGNGTADATPVFNYAGTVNGVATTGPIAGALGSAVVVLNLSTPGTATAGVAFTFQVTALNQSNSTETGYTGTIHFTSSDGSAVLPADSTLTNGTGTFSVTLQTAGNQTITAADTMTSSITGTSNTITVGVAAATHFTISAPASATSGSAFSFTVTALDASNNTATGYNGTVHFTSSDGSATLPANMTLTNGTRTFSATLRTAGSQTITATDTVTSAITGTSGTITVVAGAATHFTVSAPASATLKSAFSFTVTALDASNNTATGYGGTVHFTSSDGSATLPANATLTNGTGTFSATLRSIGTQTITAADTVTSSITGTSNTITVGAGAATHFTISAPASATSGSAFSFTVTALDASNNKAAGYGGTVHFTSSDGRATLPANTTLANGTGTFPATLRTAGSQTITATDAVTSSITGTSGAITVAAVVPPPPPPPATSSINLTSSPLQSTLGQTITFTALVSGSGGFGVPTGTVQFLDGATVLAAVGLNNGRATFSTAMLAVGSHLIVASYSGGSGYPTTQASIVLNVIALASTVTASATPANSVYGQSVTLTANVIGAATAPAGIGPPTGQVTFELPGADPFAPPTPLGTVNLVSGMASLTLNTLAVGTKTVIAQYSGDSAWSASGHQIAVNVSKASSGASVSLSVSGGSQLVLTSAVAPIAPGAGVPTGSVQFVDLSNKAVVASANLSGGKASVTVAAGAASTVLALPIVAQYSGDDNFSGSTSLPLPALVNSAADLSARFAADEIASIFGVTGLNGNTPATLPLTTSLAGTAVRVTDSDGATRPALLYGVFASTGQINFLIPSGVAAGWAVVTITPPGGTTLSTAVNIANTAPGVFTANVTGQGPYAGQVVYAHSDGTQTVMSSVVLSSGNTFVPNPINLSGPGNQVYLVLYGTGIRHATSLTATIDGVSVPVAYVGAQGTYAGLDQINLGPLPASLAGAGLVNLIITADGQAANTVTLTIE